MIMTISVIATCGATQYDLSAWVIRDSIKIDTHLFTDSLEPNTNSAEFVLSRTCPYLDELLAYDDAIGVSIAADGTTYFTGYFTDSFRFSITSRGAQDVKIECEDPGIRKLKTAWVSSDGIGTTFAGDKICDPADTAHSVIHKIATLAGVTLASGLPTISQQVYMVVLDKDGRTYWDVLSKLLLEHLYVFDFNAEGQLYLFALTGMTGSPVQTLTTQEGIIGDNSTPGIVVNKRLYDTREIDVKFNEISTIASGVVHRDTTGQTATYDCLVPIAPGAYYPDTCNADTYAYVDYKTEDGRDVVMVDSATLDVSKDSGITAEFTNLGKSARVRFYNSGGTTQYIYRLKVNATNIRVKSANSKVIAGETSRHKREIDASTITTKAEAQQYGNLLYYYYKNSKQVYQFRGYRGLLYPLDSLYPADTLYPNGDLIEPGEIVRLYDPIFTGLDANVMVTRKRYTLGRSGAEYEAVGIGTIALGDTVEAIPTTITPAPVPVSQPEIVQIAQEQAATNAPHYLGKYEAAHPSSYNNGDWWLVYDTDDSPIQRGVWYSNSGTPVRITTSSSTELQAKMTAALADIAWAEKNGYGAAANYGGFDAFFNALGAVTAFIQNLFAQNIVLGSTGYIQSNNYAESGGYATAGVKIDAATGTINSKSGKFVDATIKNAILSGGEFANVTAGNNLFLEKPSYVTETKNSQIAYVQALFMINGNLRQMILLMPCSGVVRMRFTIRTDADSPGTCYGKIYKRVPGGSWTAAGAEHFTTSTTGEEFYDDITINAGDQLQLYLKISDYGKYGYCTNYSLGIAENPGLLKYLSLEV